MKAVYHPAQERHYPPHFLVNGVFEPNPETPERAVHLLASARKSGCHVLQPPELGRAPIEAVHTGAYLDFLQRAHERWRRIEGAAPAVTPNIHPDRRDVGYPASVVAQAGYHMSDASAPVAQDTWESSCWSAWTAAHATGLVLDGERCAYALCRPPGHHAFADMAGGFCYLNNAAIAAQKLRSAYRCIAILDLDLHHGNGTQSIFYRRDDVLTVSIHADPRRFYPFFWGYADERGEGEGEGYNFNLPLPRGSADAAFLEALDAAIVCIQAYAPDALVLSLGLDAFEGDPFGGLGVTTRGFGEIGRRVAARLSRPTVIVQEGGYLCAALGDNLSSFLEGFQHG